MFTLSIEDSPGGESKRAKDGDGKDGKEKGIQMHVMRADSRAKLRKISKSNKSKNGSKRKVAKKRFSSPGPTLDESKAGGKIQAKPKRSVSVLTGSAKNKAALELQDRMASSEPTSPSGNMSSTASMVRYV